jgi:lactate dehydrogenase-like 2-hydroxyacid dehydrogenase
MKTLVQIGVFPEELQAIVDQEFLCLTPQDLALKPHFLDSVCGLITRSNYTVPLSLLESLPALQVIATCGVGFDGIPVAWAQTNGIVVTHTPGVLDDAVCELAIGLLLALLREIPAADRFVRQGRWSQGAYPLTSGLAGKSVGIVGLGRIGRGVAARLQAFGVDLSYCGSVKIDVPFRHFSSVNELAQACDILILTCKGGTETHHLINAQVLQALGPEGYLVNVARGSVVDEAELLVALRTGVIRAAALDVFEYEPLQDSELVSLPNLILSPHVGSGTQETRSQMVRLTLDNLQAVMGGRPALTPVPAVETKSGSCRGTEGLS